MLNSCWIPGWLYKLWPWMCLAIAHGYIFMDYPATGVVLAIYSFAILYKRAMDKIGGR